MANMPKDMNKMQQIKDLKRVREVDIAGGIKVKVYPLRFAIASQFITVIIRMAQNVAVLIPLIELFEDSMDTALSKVKDQSGVLADACAALDPSVMNDVMDVLNEHVDIELADPLVTHDMIPPLLGALIEQSFTDGKLSGWAGLGKQLTDLMPGDTDQAAPEKPTTKSLVDAIPPDPSA